MFLMYFSEIYSIFFLDGFFHILYLFEKLEFFMPHPVQKSSVFWFAAADWRILKSRHANHCKDADHKRSCKACTEQLRDVPCISAEANAQKSDKPRESESSNS